MEQKQAEIKKRFSFLVNEIYEALPLTRWLDKSRHPIPRHPELPVEKAAEIKILSRRDPVPLDLLLRSNLVQQELSRMNINNLSLLSKTVQVTPQVMRVLGGLLEKDVTRDGAEWAAAMASLTVSEKIRIKPSRRQNQDNERDCRTVVQQLVSSITQSVLVRTSCKESGQEIGTQKKTVTFEESDKECIEVESENTEQENLSGEPDVEGNGLVKKQDRTEKVLSGEFRWNSRLCTLETTLETCSMVDSSVDNTSRKSEIDKHSDRK